MPLGVQLADLAGGSLHGVMGLLAAVIHRQQTGEGQFVDISMTDCAFSLNGMAGAGYLAGRGRAGMEALALNGGNFYDLPHPRWPLVLMVGAWNRSSCSNSAPPSAARNWPPAAY